MDNFHGDLPEYGKPPVQEVIGSVQFPQLPNLGIAEMIRVGNELDGYELSELQPVLPAIQEVEGGAPVFPLPQFFLNEQAPQRALYRSEKNEPFVVQLQRDRVAVNERRLQDGEDPSSKHVWPLLHQTITIVEKLFAEGAGYGPSSSNLVELIYANVIRDVPVDRVLRALSGVYEEPGGRDVENASVAYSFPSYADGRFVGRVYVQAGPALADGVPVLQMQLIARRIAERHADLADVYEACHREAVETFTAVSEPEMHKIWERSR